MKNALKLNLVSIHVAAVLGTDAIPTLPESVIRPETIKALRTQEHNRRLRDAMEDPNTFIIVGRPDDMSDTYFLTEPETDTRFSTGPAQKTKTPRKSNNGLDPRLFHG